MERSKIEGDMRCLWSRIFGDTEEYVDLVFSTYFNPDLCVWRYDGDYLEAALVGVPYQFGSVFGTMRGLYLCGLSTVPECRGRGLMTDMMREIEERARRSGFAFVFLIPADRGLRKFYDDRGFSPAMYRLGCRYTAAHSFYRDYVDYLKKGNSRLNMVRLRYFERLSAVRFTLDDFKVLSCGESDVLACGNINNDVSENIAFINEAEVEFSDNENVNIETSGKSHSEIVKNDNNIYNGNNINVKSEFDKIVDFWNESERGNDYFCLMHSPRDVYAVLRENALSNGRVIIVRESGGRITGLGVAVPDGEEVKVSRIFASDRCSYFKVLHEIKTCYPDSPLTVYRFPQESHAAVWKSEFFSSATPGGEVEKVERKSAVVDQSDVYGMAKILDFRQILIFLAAMRSDSEFSILVKLEKEDGIWNFKVKGGNLHSTVIPSGELDPGSIVLTEEQLQAVLLRLPEGKDMYEEIFGIPPFPINMSLLLD